MGYFVEKRSQQKKQELECEKSLQVMSQFPRLFAFDPYEQNVIKRTPIRLNAHGLTPIIMGDPSGSLEPRASYGLPPSSVLLQTQLEPYPT